MLNCPASPETLAGTGAAAKHAVIDFLDAAGYDASTWTHSVMAGTCKATPPPTPTVPADPSSTHGWPAPSGSPRSSPRRSATATCELWRPKPRGVDFRYTSSNRAPAAHNAHAEQFI